MHVKSIAILDYQFIILLLSDTWSTNLIEKSQIMAVTVIEECYVQSSIEFSSIKTRVSSFNWISRKHRIHSFLILETRVFVLETRVFKFDAGVLILETRTLATLIIEV